MGTTAIPIRVKHTIGDLRFRKGLSLEQAAEGMKSVGIKASDKTLGRWEKDSSVLSWNQMQKFAEFYEIPLDYIFFGPNNAFSEK